MNQEKTISLTGLVNLFVIFIIWGSTYLAIRVAVCEGSGFPPFFSAAQVVAAGWVLLLWGALPENKIRPTYNELKILILSGIL